MDTYTVQLLIVGQSSLIHTPGHHSGAGTGQTNLSSPNRVPRSCSQHISTVLRRPSLHHSIPQHLVELLWVRTRSLGLKLESFLMGYLDLEADDISVLDVTLCEGVPRLHGLDHVGFDFLREGMSNQRVASDGDRSICYLVELQQCPRHPLHPLVNDRDEVAHLARIWYIYLASSGERLLRGVEML